MSALEQDAQAEIHSRVDPEILHRIESSDRKPLFQVVEKLAKTLNKIDPVSFCDHAMEMPGFFPQVMAMELCEDSNPVDFTVVLTNGLNSDLELLQVLAVNKSLQERVSAPYPRIANVLEQLSPGGLQFLLKEMEYRTI